MLKIKQILQTPVTKPANDELTDVQLDDVTGGGGDKLGNTKIQTLMSDFNEAQTMASSVLKKAHDAANSIIGKI
jgi:hypothetical protein